MAKKRELESTATEIPWETVQGKPEPRGTPLRLGEARGVAVQIRNSTVVDREYWPWVIEALCDRIESMETGKSPVSV